MPKEFTYPTAKLEVIKYETAEIVASVMPNDYKARRLINRGRAYLF
jgi:hypothetical protein